jgi:excisionase family DNA binding protein
VNQDLTIKQAAETIGVHENTIRLWIKSGTLPAYRLAGTKIIRVTRAAIDELKTPAQDGETK